MVNFDENNNIIEDDSFRAILVGLAIGEDVDSSMEELGSLVEAAGGQVLGKVVQSLPRPNSATLIGSGKVEELHELVGDMEADVVVFNHDLSGMQLRNLEDGIGCKVIDRTILILDIFAARAISRAGKLQVSLAQLEYRLPRLTGFGKSLSRQGGGIGTRGPGEQKIETDRRHIRNRIKDIRDELRELEKTVKLQRERREKNEIPVVALVGYTNVGKSAIMNNLISKYGKDEKQVQEEDILFATLDAKHRVLELDPRHSFILVDTVGFVSKLSHHLIEAFKNTLEEARYADLIVHVEDISNPDHEFQREVVEKVLGEIKASDRPRITVYNKIDRLESPPQVEEEALPEPLFISAKTGGNMEKLVERIRSLVFEKRIKLQLKFPFERGDLVNFLCDKAVVVNMEYKEDGVYMEAELTPSQLERVRSYVAV